MTPLLLRVLPLPLTAAFLAVLHGPAPTGPADRSLGLGAAALTGTAGRFPLTAALLNPVLLLAAELVGADVASPVLFILTTISLAQLWARRDGWPCWSAAAAFAAAQVAIYAPHYDPLLSTSSLVLTTGPPVLLGWHVRSVRHAREAERGRDDAVRHARLAERAAIARELRDLVAHHLASITVQVGAARHALGGAHPGVDRALDQAHGTGRAALTDLKRLMAVLRDPAAGQDGTGVVVGEAGLTTALRAAVDRTRAAGAVVEAEVDGAVAGLDSIRRISVLRVVQEGLTNVVKHAGPRPRARVRVAVGEEVRIVVADDGPAPRPPHNPGFGLVGMRERVGLLGGSISAGGWAGAGLGAGGRHPDRGRAVIRVLLVDDQHLVRAGLRMLCGSSADLDVVGEAAEGGEAVLLVERPAPDVVLMDLRMPGVDGITATARILASRPATRVLVLTTFDDDEHLYPALDAGARGFLGKDAPPEELLDAIRRTAAGESPWVRLAVPAIRDPG